MDVGGFSLRRPIDVVRQVVVVVQIEGLRRHAAGREDQQANKHDSPSGNWPAHRIPVLGWGRCTFWSEAVQRSVRALVAGSSRATMRERSGGLTGFLIRPP